MQTIENSKRKYFSQTQKLRILNELDFGVMSHSELARKYSLHPMTIYKWKRQMGQKQEKNTVEHSEILDEVKELRKENDNLKKALAELALEKQILKTAKDILQRESRKKKLKLQKKSSRK